MGLSSDNNPPVLAKIICIWTAFFSGRSLLHGLHILPYSSGTLRAFSQRPGMLLPALDFVESAILLAAAFLLWKMSKSAFRLFLLDLVIEMGAAIYLGFVAPTAETTAIRLRHPSIAVVGFGLALTYRGLPCIYAWWVTSDRRLRNQLEGPPLANSPLTESDIPERA